MLAITSAYLLLPSFFLVVSTHNIDFVSHAKRTENGLHLPIYRNAVSRNERRAGTTTSIGLGDFQDVTYNVLVQVGGTETPVVLDTGSSDLWVISDACSGSSCPPSGVKTYPQASFQSSGLDARLFYGDSSTGTHAFGEIGKDVAGVAGISIQNQYFAAINQTNTTVASTGSAGILGMGFPVNSVVWSQLFSAQFPKDSPPPSKRSNLRMTKFPDLKSLTGRSASVWPSWSSKRTIRDLPFMPDFRRTQFPDLKSLQGDSSSSTSKRASSGGSFSDLLSTFSNNGPVVSRLAEQGVLASPQFTVTLQRDSVQVGGNMGMLSLGELPSGVSNDSLTWVPLRGYTADQGGLNSPTDVYPIAWEVPIDGVILDGKTLPQSTLSPGISLTALIDTGNSLIRGPEDVVQTMYTTVTGSTTASTYDCSQPHTMAFQIGGKVFPVDPRDFVSQVKPGNMKRCSPNVVPTDPPKDGFLYSWSLGDPFLKSALVSFYFGNLTHPSVDPPRIGFMSTVPDDATSQYSNALNAASANGGTFPAQTETAPEGTQAVSTTVNGVAQAAPSQNSQNESGSKKNGGVPTSTVSWRTLATGLAAVVVLGAW